VGRLRTWEGRVVGFNVAFNTPTGSGWTSGTEFVEVRGGERNGSKDPPLQRREGKSRGPSLSRLPSFLRASMEHGSRSSYQLSIDLLFT
jgi:hypothetical protein